MGKERKWLLQEIEKWLKDHIIDQSQADRIISLYPEEKSSKNWGALIFSVIGVIIFGLGIILLFAYNWHAIPKYAKLATIFSFLLAAHAGGFYFKSKGEKFSAVSESMFALGTMFFGSGIWLISQIYNIDEHYPNAFIVWGAGALLLAWSLPSVVQGAMASVLFVIWNSFENFGFDSKINIAPLLILAFIFPLAWKMRSKILISIALPSFAISILFNCHWFFERTGPAIFISLSGFLIAISIILKKKNVFAESSSIFSFYGNIMYWLPLYVFTFPYSNRKFFETHWYDETYSTIYALVFLTAAALAWSIVILPIKRIKEDLSNFYRIDHLIVPITVIALTLDLGWLSGFDGWAGAGIFNLIFLVQSAMLISAGCRSLNAKLATGGVIMLSALAFARYSDLFSSLLVRGIVFLFVGAGIFIVGTLYSRRKRLSAEEKR
ncbi:MAG TPA: DUF2157 domain-containing protein [Victivallales bacterium]|nr:DUF2157 domain-containing protein [Victivallales bacterium]